MSPQDEDVEIDVCGYCGMFPCAQLGGCEPHWTGESLENEDDD